MTREEAIKWLKLLKSSPLIYGEYQEAIDISIEALNREHISGSYMVKHVSGEEKEYLDRTFPHEDGEWFDLTDALTKGK